MMEKDQNINLDENNINQENSEDKELKEDENENKEKVLTAEEKNAELEDKLTRTFAEMENQRRRFEKEKDEAFEYGGFSFAKEALSLIDIFERSKSILESDEKLKDSEALKKTLEHFDIIHKDLISIFSKNNIKQIDIIDINKAIKTLNKLGKYNFTQGTVVRDGKVIDNGDMQFNGYRRVVESAFKVMAK